jgi:2-polyprenyl-3-methyl-5-hydroxy-6-metoxy-1,4-benzoquinol methylase
MGIGARVRRCFGPFEHVITDVYRGFFFHVGTFTRSVRDWFPEPKKILEIGCGEGSISEHLSRLYPQAQIVGIDIAANVGKLFKGDTTRVSFRRQTIQEFAPSHRQEFDLVLVCDVLHHVPWEMHDELLSEAKSTLKEGGGFVLKDWEWRRNLGLVLGYISDRYITGDRIRFATGAELRKSIDDTFGPGCVEKEIRIQPWFNNLAFFVRNR